MSVASVPGGVHRKDDRPNPGKVPPDLLGQFEPGRSAHRDVGQEDVRVMDFELRQGLLARRYVAAYVNIVDAFKDGTDSRSEEIMVVNDKDADLAHDFPLHRGMDRGSGT